MYFNEETFGWLGDDGQMFPGWTNFDAIELESKLTELISNGITEEMAPQIYKSVETLDLFLKGVGLEAPEQVLSAVADENGLIEKILGPAIFADTDEAGNPTSIILKVGNEKIPVSLNGTEATIGNLSGDIEIEEKESTDDDGNATKFLTASFEVFFEANEQTATISVVLSKDSTLSKAQFKQLLKKGNVVKVAEHLKPIPTGESFKKLRELELGEYRVSDIEENKPHPEYGRSWKIVLEGVGAVISSGKRLTKILTDNAQMYQAFLKAGQPLTFIISSKKELSQGIQVNCGFFTREPNPNRLVATAKPAALPTVPAIPVIPEAATTQPTLDVVAEKVPVAASTVTASEVDF